jgi:hypothetical protein
MIWMEYIADRGGGSLEHIRTRVSMALLGSLKPMTCKDKIATHCAAMAVDLK